MGRISSPCLNKAGYSMFWNSMWDNKHNFSNLVCEDDFLKVCIPLIFEDDFVSDLSLYLKKRDIFKEKLDHYNVFSKNYKNISIYKSFKNNKFYSFFSKLWILRYQGWVIIYIFVYMPIFNNFLKNKNEFFKFNQLYYFIFFNYYFNLNKLNFNNKYFNNQIFYKYSF